MLLWSMVHAALAFLMGYGVEEGSIPIALTGAVGFVAVGLIDYDLWNNRD